jgi:anti-sigma regulatory factor (Ser/Thr protein kinase)
MFRFAITIQSDTRYLGLLRQMVTASARVVGVRKFPKRAQQAVSLALIEAVDNAIFHAHHRRKELPIDVVFEVDDRSVKLEVSDCGEGLNFTPMDVPPALATHGRGLFLINSSVNRVESIKKDNKHWMRMTYFL